MVTDCENPTKKAEDGPSLLQVDAQVTPTGLEQSPDSQGKVGIGGSVPPHVPPSATVDERLRELLELWDALDEPARWELLAGAKMLAERCETPHE
ncbi:MAG: hypothetical protein D6753_09910 [Planctomycetota bacterium]|nr:MAG: hypothetical protein D6753_09910 [Planctomycetota bacterium]